MLHSTATEKDQIDFFYLNLAVHRQLFIDWHYSQEYCKYWEGFSIMIQTRKKVLIPPWGTWAVQ